MWEMHKSGKSVSFWSAVAMGIGAMVGAGIFALLGQAGQIAGSAVWWSFLAGGVIALLSGYSMGRLGARYPSAGGLVEYLVQGYGPGVFSGGISVLMYISALVSVSLVARTFGTYAYELLPAGLPAFLVEVLAAGIILLFMFINLRGPGSMTRIENLVVILKMVALSIFAIAGLVTMDPTRLAPAEYPPYQTVLFSLAITFFAYEGFRIITNAAEDMPDPARTLPRAIMTSILLVMVLYVAVSLAVFGNLSADEVVKAQDYALAEAARPIFGAAGFTIMALAALLSTSSAINASLYSVTNVTYRLARLGQLPAVFGKPLGHSREGLVISSVAILIMAVFFDLSSIAAIGAISTLAIHMIVHIGHLRLLKQTGASLILVLTAIIVNLGAIVLSAIYLSSRQPSILIWIGAAFVLAFGIEIGLRFFTGRVIVKRIHNHQGQSPGDPTERP
jgi:amino acid transporter